MTAKRTGRKPKDIDPKIVEAMAFCRAEVTEIAAYLGVSPDTIHRRFQHIIDKQRASVKIKLRQKQIEVALAGEKTMLIWLGKQMLGQRDMSGIEHSGKDGGPIEITVTRKIVKPGDASAGP